MTDLRAKVVIIDDNPTTIRSLTQTIDWEARGCVIAGTATDGESGKALVLREKPDILLLDIHMPQKDGLQMLQEVRTAVPDCKVIIITGYDQFEYASRAIKLSVFDYILKPIRNAEVEEVIDRAFEDMKSRRQQAVAVRRAEELAGRAQLLSLLMNESHIGQNVHQMLKDADAFSPCFAILCLNAADEPSFPNVDEMFAAENLKSISVILYDVLVVYIMFDEETSDWKERIRRVCERIRKEVPAHSGVSECMRSHHLIRQAYHQARQMLWEQTLGGSSDSTFFYGQDMDDAKRSSLVQVHQRIEELVEKADLEDATTREAAEELHALCGKQYSNLRALVSFYAIMLCKKFPCETTQEMDRVISAGLFASGVEEVYQCLKQLCDALKNARNEKEEASYSLMTRSVLEYIRLHAAEPLRLSEVAELFHINTNYLSLLIKRETGTTFHDHVLRAKMDIAHTMLADPRIRVSEVAHAIGYSNYISFYNTFKRLEHMTPTEYRNQVAPAAAMEEEDFEDEIE